MTILEMVHQWMAVGLLKKQELKILDLQLQTIQMTSANPQVIKLFIAMLFISQKLQIC